MDRCYRFHLGVHKTATTHFQDLMALNRDRLHDAGVGYLPRKQFRQGFATVLSRLTWRVWVGGRTLERQIERVFAAGLGPYGRVTISDENILGPAADALAPRLYPRLEHNVGTLCSLGAAAPVSLYLCTRSFERFFPSVHLEALKWDPVDPRAMTALRARLRTAPPNWAGLVERLRRVAGGAPIVVWRYEDYAAHWRAIMTEFTGADMSGLDDIPRPPRTVSPSYATVSRLERLDAGLPRREWRRQARAIFEAAAGERPDEASPFEPAEATMLREAYEADLAAVARMDGVRLLRFDAPPASGAA
jgi:hypothetical protein